MSTMNITEPLPEALPLMRPERMEQLINWALLQPDAMPALLQRSAQYWDKFGDAAMAKPGADHDAIHQHIDAAAALDLLRARTGAKTNRAACEALDAKLAGCAEVAATLK